MEGVKLKTSCNGVLRCKCTCTGRRAVCRCEQNNRQACARSVKSSHARGRGRLECLYGAEQIHAFYSKQSSLLPSLPTLARAVVKGVGDWIVCMVSNFFAPSGMLRQLLAAVTSRAALSQLNISPVL